MFVFHPTTMITSTTDMWLLILQQDRPSTSCLRSCWLAHLQSASRGQSTPGARRKGWFKSEGATKSRQNALIFCAELVPRCSKFVVAATSCCQQLPILEAHQVSLGDASPQLSETGYQNTCSPMLTSRVVGSMLISCDQNFSLQKREEQEIFNLCMIPLPLGNENRPKLGIEKTSWPRKAGRTRDLASHGAALSTLAQVKSSWNISQTFPDHLWYHNWVINESMERSFFFKYT